MIVHLKNYKEGYRIVSLAKCEEALFHLQEQQLNVLYIKDNQIWLWPDQILISEDSCNVKEFLCCDDYDVFEINETGKAYLYYNNESVDNAFVITNKCNSNCVMCPVSDFVRKKETTITIDDLLEIVK